MIIPQNIHKEGTPKIKFFHYLLKIDRKLRIWEICVFCFQKKCDKKIKIWNFWMLLNDCERIVTILKTIFIVKTHYIDFYFEIPMEVCTDRSVSYVLLRSMVHIRWRGPQKDLKITDIDRIKKKHCVLASTKAKWPEKSLFGNSGHRFRFQTVTDLLFFLEIF